MQPLQMRFIVTKESIANVYSVIKSKCWGHFTLFLQTHCQHGTGIILLKHQTEFCRKLFKKLEYSHYPLISGAGLRWQVQNLVFLPGHGLCHDLHSRIFPQTLRCSRQVSSGCWLVASEWISSVQGFNCASSNAKLHTIHSVRGWATKLNWQIQNSSGILVTLAPNLQGTNFCSEKRLHQNGQSIDKVNFPSQSGQSSLPLWP